MKYDVAIVGGGIIGAGVARDAALRGLKVFLAEKEDFGSGTTSRSTRLIHGGLRYLAQYDFALVHEALRERRTLLRIAPHLVRPLPFLLPVYRNRGHSIPFLWSGLLLYDFMNPRRGVPHHRLLPANLCLRLEPKLRAQGLVGGFLFYDGQCMFPERLCLENALDAAEHGARIENHTRVVELERKGNRVAGLRIRDELTKEERSVESQLVLNCAGPWLDEVDQLAAPGAEPQLRRTKGIHLVVPRFAQHALILESQNMDRVVFAIPWGDYTLVGTTDTDYEGRNEDVRAEPEDIDYLIAELETNLQHRIEKKDILFTTAGLRPLKRELHLSPAEITRRHEVLDHEKVSGLAGYSTVVGGKITTYRQIAQDVVDFAMRKLKFRRTACVTDTLPLPGGRIEGPWAHFVDDVRREAQRIDVPGDVAQHLAETYGSEAMGLLDAIHSRPALNRRIDPDGPWVWAEVHYAVGEEHARTLTDVMLRRLSIGLGRGQGANVVKDVAGTVADLQGWNEARVAEELRGFEATLGRNWRRPIEGPSVSAKT